MDNSLRRYLKISFINLGIVAAIGSILRYKIAYSLPFVDQKHLLHAHSNFAFVGWISHTLMVLMIYYLQNQTGKDEYAYYKKYLVANLVAAYGMLIVFPIQGYGLFSIFFSMLSIIVAYTFAYSFWRDLNLLKEKSIVHSWFKGALLLNIVSSAGTFALTYMMVNRIVHQTWYLGAQYYYLHFQYNGWFLFVCIGLLYTLVPKELSQEKVHKQIFWLFMLSIFPAYFLSALWMPLPSWMFIVIIIASLAQFYAWVLLVIFLYKNRHNIANTLSIHGKRLLLLSGIALTVKFSLQLGSNIPALSKLAFGFRPIVIAYLHLVFLGVITLFLLGYIFSFVNRKARKWMLIGLTFFAVGIFFNEFVLMVQGVASFSYTAIPYINQILLIVALTMFFGILLMAISRFKIDKPKS
jgi:hypothetical protein